MPNMVRLSRCVAVGATLACLVGCGSSSPSANAAGGSPGSAGSDNSGVAGSGPISMGTSTAADVAAKLGRPANFLIGMGNDLNNDHSMDGAYTLGTTLDIHYAYLSAYQMNGGFHSWVEWNTDGTFVNILTDSASAKGVVPMFSMYEMAAVGDGALAALTTDAFEKLYWSDMTTLFKRLGAFDKPAIVHLEPDFWAYAQQQSKGDPASMKVKVKANAPDCADLSDDLIGMGHCLVKLARKYAPKTLLGFHASEWAGDPAATAAFLKAVGAGEADVVFADMLDRDAGCFEAHTDPVCQRTGTFYWDESNTTSPNFSEYLAWSKAISSGVGRPMMWWQIPLGVPSTTPGGSMGHYRDNRVHYLFSHVQEFVNAGGVAALFGTGAEHQTYIDSDGGQFKTAVTGYFAHPVALP